MNQKETLNILDEIGGPQGIADSSLPSLAFVIFFTFSDDIFKATIAALVLSIILAGIRIHKGESLKFVIAGIIGIALSGFIATRTGNAEDFFLPGIIMNGVYALLYFLSILIRWPLMGIILETGTGRGTRWREDPTKVRLYSRVSYPWIALFCLRFIIQIFLYMSGSIIALGIVKTIMGLPLFLLCIWISWVMLKRGGVDVSQFISAFSKEKSQEKG